MIFATDDRRLLCVHIIAERATTLDAFDRMQVAELATVRFALRAI